MAALIERVGKIDLATRLKRRSEERPADAYGALLRAIVGQQLSTKAARTIYLRVLDLFGGTTPSPEQLLEASEADLRGAGLSGRKVEYIRDLAAHVLSGELELDRLDELGDEEVIEEIVAVRGLGQWTAEMFLLFHLERPDVLSGGDLGIRKAIQIEYGLEEMPTPTQVLEIGEPWRPHRSLASLYLWESLAAVPGVRQAASGSASPPLTADRRRLGDRGGARSSDSDDSADFHAMQRDEAVRAAHQAESVAGLSVGQLSSAAAFFQAEGDLSQARVRGRRPAAAQRGGPERDRLHPRRARLRTGSASNANHGVPIFERGPARSAPPSRAAARLLPDHLRRRRVGTAARRSATTSAPTPSGRPSCAAPATSASRRRRPVISC